MSRYAKLIVTMLAVLAVCATAAFAVGGKLHTHDGYVTEIGNPWGASYTHDCNGRVPEYNAALPGDTIGRTSLGCVATIRYDYAYMRNHNATGCGWDTLMRHERAHARGFAHGEGFPPNGDGVRQQRENPAYYPSVNVRCTQYGGVNIQSVPEGEPDGGDYATEDGPNPHFVDMSGDTR